jgi:hypothetical protein
MLLNAYGPAQRERQEASSLIGMGRRVRLVAWNGDRNTPASNCREGLEAERVFVSSRHGRGDLDTLPLGFLFDKLKLAAGVLAGIGR